MWAGVKFKLLFQSLSTCCYLNSHSTHCSLDITLLIFSPRHFLKQYSIALKQAFALSLNLFYKCKIIIPFQSNDKFLYCIFWIDITGVLFLFQQLLPKFSYVIFFWLDDLKKIAFYRLSDRKEFFVVKH